MLHKWDGEEEGSRWEDPRPSQGWTRGPLFDDLVAAHRTAELQHQQKHRHRVLDVLTKETVVQSDPRIWAIVILALVRLVRLVLRLALDTTRASL